MVSDKVAAQRSVAVASGTRSWSVPRHLAPASLSRPALDLLLFLRFCLHVLLTLAFVGVRATQMNSLSYLSRQFDVLAAPRTPPSTPVSESGPLLADAAHATELKRVRTWSTKSFLILPPSDAGSSSWALKRSYSSPADVNPIASAEGPAVQLPPTLTVPVPPRRPSAPPSRRPSVSSTEKALRPRRSENFLRHLFFVRVVLLLWNAICSAWRSITRRTAVRATHAIAVEDGSSDDEKETEDESKDNKPVVLEPPTPPIPPVIPPPLPASPSLPSPSITEPPIPLHLVPSSALLAQPLPPERKPDSPIPSAASFAAPPVVALRTSPQPQSGTRSPTPSGTRKTPFHLPKTLVLDLDETLIHSTSRPMSSISTSSSGLLGLPRFGRRNKGAGHVVEVVLGGKSTVYHVYKRPFVDYFLRQVSKWYTLVIFTASMQEYADPVIDWLDAGRGILARRFFRESCTQLPNGSYTKDLSIIEQDLTRVCLIDNSPICYTINEANGIPIEGWTHDPHDEALLDLLPVLDSLRFTSDVRRVLGIRGFS
ncbi:NIF-domain-containing protein, partial [Obba rivulosa]